MKILVCGAGRITDELLKRVSEDWAITVVDKNENKLGDLSHRFASVRRVVHGDASSPVVLEEAGLSGQDYVLALTNDDRVNHAIATFAEKQKIRNIMAVVRDPEMLPKLRELNVWTTLTTTVAARKIYNHLKDPRLSVIDLGQGEGEILELELDDTMSARMKNVKDFNGEDWRLIGILRKGHLIFPKPERAFQKGDRLLILGKSDLFEAFVDYFDREKLHFPLNYGQVLVLGILPEGASDKSGLFNEALYLARNTQIEKLRVVCDRTCTIRDQIEQWAESLHIDIESSEGSIREAVAKVENAGIIVLPVLSASFLESVAKPVMISFAHALECPLLISRNAIPYENILVPFNGNDVAESALEVAIDLAGQCDARLSVLMVEEPDFLHGNHESPDRWRENMAARVRFIAHIRKTRIDEQVRSGNPVKEILFAARQYDLLIIASSHARKELLEPNVAETIVREAPCSVLVVTN